eukprot:UN19130
MFCRCTHSDTQQKIPTKRTNHIFFDEETFVRKSRSNLFPSEVLIVSNISFFKPYRSFSARLNLAEKQFQAAVTNQVFAIRWYF